MPYLTRGDAMRLLCTIADKKEMKAAVHHAWKGAGVVSTVAFIGGLLGGPPGLAVGGTVGGLVAWMVSEPFKPVPEILMELSPAEEQKLFNELRGILKNWGWRDIADLTVQVLSNERLQQQVARMLMDFLQTQLKAKVRCGS
ncbi:protein C19orf12 homolog [Pteronotus mesoamericanus]|uniref:protein C19orf12 homolog n=1 Tax=Pteronotus mesoamericanus TaxID=1884717 RepID=UPI0023EDF348|nr:protein C19orf12 homolog [Pteronotus parnellii mesoamericanus]